MEIQESGTCVFDFGACSMATLGHASKDQCILHASKDTVIRFSISSQQLCEVDLVFHPFRRDCNLTYHEYKIICAFPLGTPKDTSYKSSIIGIAHRLYENHFIQNAGFKLQLLEEE